MSKVSKTLWLSSLPYPFNAFFSSLKKRQSVLRITGTMLRMPWLLGFAKAHRHRCRARQHLACAVHLTGVFETYCNLQYHGFRVYNACCLPAAQRAL